MPRFDERTLAASLKNGERYPVYLLSGGERFLLDYALDTLLSYILPGGKDSPLLQRFDGEHFDIDRFVTEAMELPMFMEQKCLLAIDPDLEKMDSESFDGIVSLLEDPNPSTVLCFFCGRKPLSVKSARGKKFWALCEKVGAGVLCEEKSPRELIRLITARAVRGSSKIGEREAEHLLSRCGSDLLTLMTEVDKLSAFRHEGVISAEDIDLLTRRNLEASVFDLSRFIRGGQSAKAFSLIHELIGMKEEPIAVLGALNMAYLDLYRAKLGAVSRKGEGDIAKDFAYKSSYRVKNALRSARDYSMDGLRQCLSILSDTDKKIKSSRAEGRLLLEEAVYRLMQVK